MIADSCIVDGCRDTYQRCFAPDATATVLAAHALLVIAFRHQVRGDRLGLLAAVEEAHDLLAAYAGAPSCADLSVATINRAAERRAQRNGPASGRPTNGRRVASSSAATVHPGGAA